MKRGVEGREGIFSLFCFLPELLGRGGGSRVFFYDVLCWNGERQRMGEVNKKDKSVSHCVCACVLICSVQIYCN